MRILLVITALGCFIWMSCDKNLKSSSFTMAKEQTGIEEDENQIFNVNDIPKELSGKDLIVYIEDLANGYRKNKQIGDMDYNLQYRPHDYILALEDLNMENKKGYDERISEISDLDYFTLKIRAEDFNQELLRYRIKHEEDYYKRLQYYMSDMQKDIYIKAGKDSISCVLFHFERTFGIVPYLTFSCGFERNTNIKSERTFVFEDPFFGGGTVKLRLPKEIFTHYPKLKN